MKFWMLLETLAAIGAAMLLTACEPESRPSGAGAIVAEETATMKKATFAAGCFWGVESAFQDLKGVASTAVGFSGGTAVNPTYYQVCAGKTGHAEVLHLTYDPAVVSYEVLLAAFWKCHDPTTLNRQGPDVGSQYRSAIFFHDAEQEAAARAAKDKEERSGKHSRPVVTQIAPAAEFFRAEEYHQRYLEKRGLRQCHTP